MKPLAIWKTVPLLAGAGLLALGCTGPAPAPHDATPDLATIAVDADSATSGPGWDGVVEAVQQAVISAQTSGRIARIEADVTDRVAAGAVLLRLTDVEQKAGLDAAQAQLKAAEAMLAEAESRHRRASELVGKQLLSRADYDVARAARDSAQAARDAAQATVQQASQTAAYTIVRAPYAGIVSARRVEAGETVVPGQPLFGFYAPGALRIEVQVPQSVAAGVRARPKARVVFGDGRAVEGASVTVFPSADPQSHTVTVRVGLPALAPAPEPGVTAKVLFPSVAEGSALRSVPVAALVQRGEVSGVYVVEGSRVSLRQLRLGARHGAQVEVIAGLEPGERIAADPVAATQWLARRQAAGAGRHE